MMDVQISNQEKENQANATRVRQGLHCTELDTYDCHQHPQKTKITKQSKEKVNGKVKDSSRTPQNDLVRHLQYIKEKEGLS